METTFKNIRGEWVTYPNIEERIQYLESEVLRLEKIVNGEESELLDFARQNYKDVFGNYPKDGLTVKQIEDLIFRVTR